MIAAALVVGFFAGLHISTWGMYLDRHHEPFSWVKYTRSLVLAMVIAVSIELVTQTRLSQSSQIIVLFGTTYAVERAITEGWKGFVRQVDQTPFFIPTQMNWLGKLVESRLQRAVAGIGYTLILVGTVLALYQLDKKHLDLIDGSGVGLLGLVLAGSIGGWFSATGGALKDAPFEGFGKRIFFRSPVVAILFSLVLTAVTTNLVWLNLATLGFTVATIETYKKFLKPLRNPGTVPGKFKKQEVRIVE